MPGKCLGLAKDNDPVFALPVPVHAPPIAFVRVPPGSPSAELVVHTVVHLPKDGLRHDMGVVPGPARNYRPQGLDQRLLAGAAMPLDQGTRPSKVTLLRVPTGFNQRLKAEELSHTVLSAPMSANGILADMVAEKVASDLALVEMQGVGEARFTRFEPQTNVPQPPFRLLL
jgi:hypothetical protein